MKLDCRTAIVLKHPDNNQVLLLRRAPFKKLLPNLITGIGGKVELDKGEGDDLEKALLREVTEETKIDTSTITEIELRLSTLHVVDSTQFIIFWFTGKFSKVPENLSCKEGVLNFYSTDNLPLEEFTPHAREAIPFILSAADHNMHSGAFDTKGSLIVN